MQAREITLGLLSKEPQKIDVVSLLPRATIILEPPPLPFNMAPHPPFPTIILKPEPKGNLIILCINTKITSIHVLISLIHEMTYIEAN